MEDCVLQQSNVAWDENGRRKDDEWPQSSPPNDSGETSPSPVMATFSQLTLTGETLSLSAALLVQGKEEKEESKGL